MSCTGSRGKNAVNSLHEVSGTGSLQTHQHYGTNKLFLFPGGETRENEAKNQSETTHRNRVSTCLLHDATLLYTVRDIDAHLSTLWIVAISGGVTAAVLAGVGVLLLSEKFDRPQHQLIHVLYLATVDAG